MCIVIWSTRKFNKFELIIISNRDEYLSRESLNARIHSFDDQLSSSSSSSKDKKIISGIDLKGGGTWLGIEMKMVKFGFVTNISKNEKNEKEVAELMMNEEEEEDDDNKINRKKLSRGKLVKDFLMGFKNVKTYINSLSELDKQMDGFNLIVGSLKEEANKIVFGFHSNQSEVKNLEGWNEFENGMSNGIIRDHKSEWEKVRIGKSLLGELLKERYCEMNDDDDDDDDRLINDLFTILSQTHPSNSTLAYNILVRPYHRLEEPSSTPKRETWYGTKTQTLILVSKKKKKKITFVERDAFTIVDETDQILGSPVWQGEDRTRWRKFDFEMDS